MTLILMLFLSLSAFAQQFHFKADGSFQTRAAPGAQTPTTVNYTISWNETATDIQGIYQDNYFAQTSPLAVGGTPTANGRTFTIIFPQPVYGVRQIMMKTSSTGFATGSTDFHIRTLDNVGSEIDDFRGFALLASTPQKQETEADETRCVTGFGVLTHMCGLYNGTINEVSDTRNRCNLAAGAVRLELGDDSVFRFYPDYTSNVPDQSFHNLGAFLPSPMTTTISVSRQECGELPGTTFVPGNCRTLTLSGTFNSLGNLRQFTGNYTISDDVNGDRCQYSMVMGREISY